MGKFGKHEKELTADCADYADIHETGLVGSLERMGSHGGQN
jgi:hypothetical protein